MLMEITDGYLLVSSTGNIYYSTGYRVACERACDMSKKEHSTVRVYRLQAEPVTGRLLKSEEAQYIDGE